MQKLIYTLSISLLFFSCTKKTEVRGRAFSRYYYPLKNQTIKLYTSRDSKYSSFLKDVAITDDDGYYSFCYRTKNKSNYYIQIRSDSGNSNSYNIKNGKTHEINLIIGQ